jgi:hypothetical protein
MAAELPKPLESEEELFLLLELFPLTPNMFAVDSSMSKGFDNDSVSVAPRKTKAPADSSKLKVLIFSPAVELCSQDLLLHQQNSQHSSLPTQSVPLPLPFGS